jgi:manganese-dependent inorganic pyrophosphatase
MKKIQTVVIGHRNPDTDSCAAATGYAALKTAMGKTNVIAASAGYASARTEFLFKKFKTPLPKVIEDISPRVDSVMDTSPTIAYAGETLLDAMEYLRESRMSRIPITDNVGQFVGMISLFDLAERMFQKARSNDLNADEDGVVGRGVRTSLALASKSLHGRITSLACDENEIIDHNVYVGAMSIERLKAEVLNGDNSQLVIVVGDRANMQEVLVESKIRLMIVTGNASVDLDLIRRAKEYGTSILQTPFDSASTVRRLKFSQPVESMTQKNVTVFSANEKISDIYHTIMTNQAENYPVCDNNGKLLGSLTKLHIDREPPVRLVLVDHNEIDQAVRGANEVPIVEIMDHHRIAISPTDKPITVINDVVGSTSTLVCEQYRRFGIKPTPEIAGILMGGIVTDTLLLRSPTSTERDKVAIEYLEQISGSNARQLLDEIFNIGSMIATEPAYDVIHQDKKNYKSERFAFSVSQIEESGFEHFYKEQDKLLKELNILIEQENIDFASLLVTDIVLENSLLLVAGKQNIINALPFSKKSDNLYRLPGILSRKKQLLPVLLKTFVQI